MLRQKMAMALLDIDEYQKMAAQAKQAHEAIAHTKPTSAGLVISETEMDDMADFEQREDTAIKRIADTHVKLAEAKAKFLAVLPKSAQEEMRTQGKAVYASWVEQNASQRKYGPYAAYFSNEELTVVAFSNYHHFAERFERMRAEEKDKS